MLGDLVPRIRTGSAHSARSRPVGLHRTARAASASSSRLPVSPQSRLSTRSAVTRRPSRSRQTPRTRPRQSQPTPRDARLVVVGGCGPRPRTAAMSPAPDRTGWEHLSALASHRFGSRRITRVLAGDVREATKSTTWRSCPAGLQPLVASGADDGVWPTAMAAPALGGVAPARQRGRVARDPGGPAPALTPLVQLSRPRVDRPASKLAEPRCGEASIAASVVPPRRLDAPGPRDRLHAARRRALRRGVLEGAPDGLVQDVGERAPRRRRRAAAADLADGAAAHQHALADHAPVHPPDLDHGVVPAAVEDVGLGDGLRGQHALGILRVDGEIGAAPDLRRREAGVRLIGHACRTRAPGRGR